MAFHDLTPGNKLPPATSLVMGLGQKFVLVPDCPTPRKKSMEAFERFHRSLDLKVFFAGSDDNDEYNRRSKLYVRSQWRPFNIPREVNNRLYCFEIDLCQIFF